MTKVDTILDNVTDISGIAALTTVAYYGVAEPTVVGAIATIALGKRYLANQSAGGQ